MAVNDPLLEAMRSMRPDATPTPRATEEPRDPFTEAMHQQRKAHRDQQRKTLEEAPPASEAAEAKKLGEETGLPASEIISDVEAARRTVRARKLLEMSDNNPAVARALNEGDLATAASLVEDMENVGVIDRTIEFFSKLPSRLGAGATESFAGASAAIPDKVANIGDYLSYAVSVPIQIVAEQHGYEGDLTEAPLERIEARAQLRRDQRAYAGEVRERNRSDSFVVESLLSGTEFVPLSITAALTRNPRLATAIPSVTVGQMSYDDAREKGLSFNQAIPYAASQGVTEYLTERIPAGRLVDALTGATPFGRSIVRSLASEIPNEQVATAIQDLSDYAYLPENANKSLMDYVRERPEAAMATLLGTVSGTSIQVGAASSFAKAADVGFQMNQRFSMARQARQEGKFFSDIADALSKSKMRESDPEGFAKLLRDLGESRGLSTVLLDGNAARTYLQSDSYDPATDPLAPFAEDILDAAAAGNDVALPFEVALGEMAGTPAFETLREDMRLTAGGMTPREAAALEEGASELEQELDTIIGERQSTATDQQGAREKRVEKLAEKFEEAGHTPYQSRQLAELVASRIENRAARGGIKDADRAVEDFAIRMVLPPELQRSLGAGERDMVIAALRGNEQGSTSRARAAAAELGGILERRGFSPADLSDEQLGRIVDQLATEGEANGREYRSRGRDEHWDGEALADAPKIKGEQFGPVQGIVDAARAYAEEAGIDHARQGEYVEVDPEFAGRLADAYEQMEHAPNDPAVAEAYADMIRQTRAQYDALVAAGFTFSFGDPDGDYFASGFNALRDMRDNQHMQVFPTAAGFGSDATFDPSENPLFEDTGLTWTDHEGNEQTVYANDLFRAVHDAFGHGIEGAGFRDRGEENAWQAHARLFTGPALAAMTSETRGQNSWVNYGPHGEKNRTASAEDTVYADQKTGLLPSWAWTERVAPDMGALYEQDLEAGETATATADGIEIGWTQHRIDDLVRSFGYASEPERTKAYAVRMSPDQFLGLTASEEGRRLISERVEGMEEYGGGEIDFDQMRQNGQPLMLVVDVSQEREVVDLDASDAAGEIVKQTLPEEARVMGHEGRHRMTMLKRAGVTSVPVVMILENRVQPSSDSIDAKPQRSAMERVSTGDTPTLAEGMVPISYGSRDQLAEVFGRGRELFQRGPTIREVATSWTVQHHAEHGGPLEPVDNPEHYQIVLDGFLADYAEQVGEADDGSNWYSGDIMDALEVTQAIIPELADPIQRETFLAMAAILSPQRNPVANWELAIQAMQAYLRTGRVPVTKENGKAFGVPSTTTGLTLLDHMIQTMGAKEAMAWIAEPHNGREVAELRRDSGAFGEKDGLAGYKASEFNYGDEKLGAYAFGGKVGAFMSNVMGFDQNAVTVDMWAYRAYARHAGRLLEDAQESEKTGVAQQPKSAKDRSTVQALMTDAAAQAGTTPSAMQAALWYSEQRRYRDEGIRAESASFSEGARRAAEARGIRPVGIVERGDQGRDAAAGGSNPRDLNQSALPATIEVGGKQRSTTNSEGQQIAATEEGVRNFWAWFGDSKVVDEQGRPLVVYHASLSGFDEFREGSHFGSSEQAAMRVAAKAELSDEWRRLDAPSRANQRPQTYPTYLKIENPKRTRDFLEDENSRWTKVRRAAEAGGHDGLVYDNLGERTSEAERSGDSWVISSPEQVKSTNNVGSFSPTDPRILYQSAYHGSPHIFDRFSLEAIGTGEGNQAYGWGLYFAGRKQIAEHYRSTLSDEVLALPDGSKIKLDNGRRGRNDVMLFAGMSGERGDRVAYHVQAALFAAERMDDGSIDWEDAIFQTTTLPFNASEQEKQDKEDAEAVVRKLADAGAQNNRGRLYEVEIPEDGEYLLWDRPFSEQPEKVKEALRRLDLDPEKAMKELAERSRKLQNERDRLVESLNGDTPPKDAFEATMRIREIDEESAGIDRDMDFLDDRGADIYHRLSRQMGGINRADRQASQTLLAAGIAGIKYLDGGSRSRGQGSYNYVVFDDSRVEIRSFEQATVFYSALERAAEAVQTTRAPAQQWAATLKKTAGVKQEELEWTGILDWLDVQKGPVEKDQLLEVIRRGGIVVREVVLGRDVREVLDEYGVDEDSEDYEAIVGDYTEPYGQYAPKFGSWTTDPSNDTYRELLITLPRGEQSNPERAPSTHWDEDAVVAHARFMEKEGPNGERILFVEEVQSDWHQKGRDQGYEGVVDPAVLKAAQDAYEKARKAHTDAVLAYNEGAREFGPVMEAELRKSNEAQVGSITFETARDARDWREAVTRASGIRDIEAVEADSAGARPWEQLGRFAWNKADAAIKKGIALAYYEPSEEYHILKEAFDSARAAAREAEEESALKFAELQNARGEQGIPNAPFKKSWPELVMKRMIAWASTNGYDQIAWTWGQQQAERYNLSQAVGAIHASRSNATTSDGAQYYLVGLNDSRAAHVILENTQGVAPNGNDGELLMTEAAMKEAFGGDVARKITEGVAASRDVEEELASVQEQLSDAKRRRINSANNAVDFDVEEEIGRLRKRRSALKRGWAVSLHDNDLTVGGEGMKQFYDKNLVNITNKLVKKYGAKVEMLPVLDDRETGGAIRLREAIAAEEERAENGSTEWDRENAKERLVELRALQEGDKQPALKITPELREAAASGFPLFQPDHKTGPRGRILFPDQTDEGAIIELFQGANLSTVIHEVSHLWLEELKADASRPDAPDQLKRDYATVLAWFKDNGYEVRDGVIPVGAHEMWARTGERYMREGKAPSVSLQRAFEAFRNWLTEIYKTLVGLRAPITPEIRDVFDRLIASDEEIQIARETQALEALFDNAAAAGMSKGEFQNYQEQVADARAEAAGKVLEKSMKTIRDRETRLWKQREREVREQVAAEIEEEPVFKALAVLRNNRIDREWLVDTFGEEVLSALPSRVPPLFKADGVDPEMAAEMAGFSSAQAMVERLVTAQAEQAAAEDAGDTRNLKSRTIGERVERIMRAEFGDPMTEGQIEQEAIAAVNSEKQGEVLASEIRVLSRTVGKRPAAYKVAREWARRRVRSGDYATEASPSAIQRHRRAISRAGKEAELALAKGDTEAALLSKQQQMLSSALMAEAKLANEEVEAARKRMKKVADARTMRSVDQDYLEQAHALLEAVDLKERSQASINRKGKWAAWVAEREAEMLEVVVPAEFEAQIGNTNWSRLPIEQLLGLDEAVKQVIHFGRFKQRLIDDKDARDFAAIKAEVKAQAEKAGKKEVPSDFKVDGLWDRIKSRVAQADVALLKMETIFDWLDNGDPNGVFNRYVFRPLANAAARERDMIRDFHEEQKANFEMIDEKTLRSWRNKVDTGMTEPKTGLPWTPTREQLVAMALNWGNAGNRQRVVDGYGFRESQIEQLLMDTLSEQEWQFVQATWDTIGKLWPEIAAMERRVNGVEPEKVEATEVQTPYGLLRGGYYPAIYNTKIDRKARQHSEESEDLMNAMTVRATTKASSTKERADAVKRPILLDLGVINRHMAEVIHDITHREAIIQANRLLSDPEVLDEVDAVLGREYSDGFRPWLKFIANQWAHDRAANEGMGWFYKKMRANATVVGMGWRFTTMMTQLAGYSNSIEILGATRMSAEIAKASANPIDTFNFVMERSGVMRSRVDTIDRDINQAMRDMTAPKAQRKGKQALTSAKVFAFHGIGYMDRIVSIPTWMAGYNRALENGADEQQAIYEGDKAVRMSQGSNDALDLAPVQRGTGNWGELLKFATMFYSYMSAFYQRQRHFGRDLTRAEARELPALIARAWWLFIVPPVLAELLAGRGPDEDEDAAWWGFKKMVSQMLGPIPIARDLWEPAWDKFNNKPSYGYRFTPAQGGVEAAINVAGDVGRISRGEETKRATRNSIELLGYTTGLATGQMAQSAQFWVDVAEGEQDPDGAWEMIEGTMKGKVDEE